MLKVLWLGRPEVEVTWEPASTLSVKLIKEFEDGIVSEAVETSNDLYGQQTSTLGVESNERSTSPPMKKLKRNPRKQHWVSTWCH